MCDGKIEYGETVCADKPALRKYLSEVRKNIPDKSARCDMICFKAQKLVGGNVMAYVSIGSEVSTDKLIRELMQRGDVTVFVPYTIDGEIFPRKLKMLGTADKNGNLPENRYCDKMPVPPTKIDVCITPLLGFNKDCYRIGYGKGCFDRFFAKTDAYKIGLAFAAQQINFAPEPHDIPLDCCVTEKSVIYSMHARDIG